MMRVEKYYYSDAQEHISREERLSLMEQPEKKKQFYELIPMCQTLAQNIGANLQMGDDDHAGWAIFVGNPLNFKKANKQDLNKLIELSDEVNMRPSVDVQENSPTDVEGAVQVEFWFDFIRYSA